MNSTPESPAAERCGTLGSTLPVPPAGLDGIRSPGGRSRLAPPHSRSRVARLGPMGSLLCSDQEGDGSERTADALHVDRKTAPSSVGSNRG